MQCKTWMLYSCTIHWLGFDFEFGTQILYNFFQTYTAHKYYIPTFTALCSLFTFQLWQVNSFFHLLCLSICVSMSINFGMQVAIIPCLWLHSHFEQTIFGSNNIQEKNTIFFERMRNYSTEMLD